MKRERKVLLFFLRLAAALLLFLSIQKSWAGFDFYQGYLAFKNREYESAVAAFSKALKHDSSNPELIDLWTQSAWHLGVKSKDRSWFEAVSVSSQRLNERMPYFGKAWLYRAMSEHYLIRSQNGKMSKDQWRNIKGFILKAHQGEPESPWMNYMTAKLLLSEGQFLLPGERQQALDWIKKSLRGHFSHEVSYYLEPAFEFLWGQFSNLEILRYVTPVNVFSYYKLLEFTETHDIWAGRDEILTTALKLGEADYIKRCQSAERLLQRGNFERALFGFQIASGISMNFVRAKAGILICRQNLQNLEEDVEIKLKQILEDEEEDLSHLIEFLGGLIVLTENPYLRGLYSFRRGDFASARLWLEMAGPELKHKFQRRYLAYAYWQLGEKMKAVDILKTVLDEEYPDLRDLFLLTEWDTPYRQRAVKKAEQLATHKLPETAWWRDGVGHVRRLDRKGSASLPVNLKAGQAILHLPMRGFPDSAGVYPYIRIQFWDQDRPYAVAESYRNHKDWKTAAFPIKTMGGKRWLSVELANGTEQSSARRGPILQFGSLEIKYSQLPSKA